MTETAVERCDVNVVAHIEVRRIDIAKWNNTDCMVRSPFRLPAGSLGEWCQRLHCSSTAGPLILVACLRLVGRHSRVEQ